MNIVFCDFLNLQKVYEKEKKTLIKNKINKKVRGQTYAEKVFEHFLSFILCTLE